MQSLLGNITDGTHFPIKISANKNDTTTIKLCPEIYSNGAKKTASNMYTGLTNRIAGLMTAIAFYSASNSMDVKDGIKDIFAKLNASDDKSSIRSVTAAVIESIGGITKLVIEDCKKIYVKAYVKKMLKLVKQANLYLNSEISKESFARNILFMQELMEFTKAAIKEPPLMAGYVFRYLKFIAYFKGSPSIKGSVIKDVDVITDWGLLKKKIAEVLISEKGELDKAADVNEKNEMAKFIARKRLGKGQTIDITTANPTATTAITLNKTSYKGKNQDTRTFKEPAVTGFYAYFESILNAPEKLDVKSIMPTFDGLIKQCNYVMNMCGTNLPGDSCINLLAKFSFADPKLINLDYKNIAEAKKENIILTKGYKPLSKKGIGLAYFTSGQGGYRSLNIKRSNLGDVMATVGRNIQKNKNIGELIGNHIPQEYDMLRSKYAAPMSNIGGIDVRLNTRTDAQIIAQYLSDIRKTYEEVSTFIEEGMRSGDVLPILRRLSKQLSPLMEFKTKDESYDAAFLETSNMISKLETNIDLKYNESPAKVLKAGLNYSFKRNLANLKHD